MNESLDNYMKVGLVSFMAYPEIMAGEGDVFGTIKKLVTDEYFTAIEVTWVKDPATRRRVAELLATSRMEVVYEAAPRLLSHRLNLNDTEEEGRRAAVAELKDALQEAHELGAGSLVFLSGRYSETEKEGALAALVRSTEELCAYAKSIGNIKLVLEVFDHDVDKRCLIGPSVLAREYAERVSERYDNFGLIVDLGHLPLLRETPEESLALLGDYLAHAHIGNAVCNDPSLPAYGDRHPRFGFPGGANDIPQLTDFLKGLLKMGFLNKEVPPIVSFEVKPWGDEDSDAVVAGCKRTLNEAWARLDPTG